jgi:hypothetical protein
VLRFCGKRLKTERVAATPSARNVLAAVEMRLFGITGRGGSKVAKIRAQRYRQE